MCRCEITHHLARAGSGSTLSGSGNLHTGIHSSRHQCLPEMTAKITRDMKADNENRLLQGTTRFLCSAGVFTDDNRFTPRHFLFSPAKPFFYTLKRSVSRNCRSRINVFMRFSPVRQGHHMRNSTTPSGSPVKNIGAAISAEKGNCLLQR